MFKLVHTPSENGKRKKFYRYIKSLQSDCSGIPTLQKDGKSYTDSQDKARILNDYSCTVFSSDSDNDLPTIGVSPFPSIAPIVLQPNGIIKLLQDLDSSKAAGPDQIPAKFLKLFAEELSPSLFILFSASLKQGAIPLNRVLFHLTGKKLQ